MRRLEFMIPEEMDGIKVRSFLRINCGVSARLLTKLKKEPFGITVNGTHVRTIDILHKNDLMMLSIPEDHKQLEAKKIALSVIFEDEDLLIINKPHNMPIHPSPGHDCDTLANAVAGYYQEKGEQVPLRAVYRLDKNTSGVVVVAKNSYVACKLSTGITKEYTALCEGVLIGDGIIDAPIKIADGHGIQRQVGKDGIYAVTHWKVVMTDGCNTIVKLHLDTGRTHQIRVHMSSIGHPLAGDDMYGGNLSMITRQALHCGYVSFMHPITAKRVEVFLPLPDDMAKIPLMQKHIAQNSGEMILRINNFL